MDLDLRVNGKTVLTGLIGNPVAHTVSPVLQNSFYTALGINGIYLPFKVPAGKLVEAVKGMKALGFAGFNITIPYKNDIVELADEISEDVKLLGAANTIKIKDGRLFAFNTDADGFASAFKEQTGSDFIGKKVCVLGAGGTAKALATKIALNGAQTVNIINRTEEKAAELALNINNILKDRAISYADMAFAREAGSDEARQQLTDCDIIVNTTSVGMHPDTGSCPVPENFIFQSRQIVYDTIYNPIKTIFLQKAQSRGCASANGAGMLFHQGLKAFEIWNDVKLPQSVVSSSWDKFIKYLNG